MRHARFLTLAFLAAPLLFGCGKPPASAPDADSRIATAKEKIGEAGEATADAARAKRDEFALEMSKRLDELDVKYEELKDRAAKAEGEARQDLEKKLEEAKLKRDAAAGKLDELKEAGADRWEKVKLGVGDAIDDLKKVLD